MKTRIISGAVLVAIFAVILFVSIEFPIVMCVATAILAAIAVYEALYATGIAKNKVITAVGVIFAAIWPFALASGIKVTSPTAIAVVFVLVQFALYLKFHKDIKLDGMLGMIILPIAISYAFYCFFSSAVRFREFTPLFYIVLILCWSAVADTGAYFVGIAVGKHKMAPVISPKKSWEGLIGGMVVSILAVFGVCALYTNFFETNVNTLLVMIMTPLFVLIGVLGDLTASLIKRKCEIKDFGKLIPGHGGVLDRFDSILMISVALDSLMYYETLIK
jgi:phosphatidate cytidylyltransferase